MNTSAFQLLSEKLNKTLAKLGISEPTEIQQQAIPEILAGHDLMASAETGSGKTAAFLLPIIQKLVENPAPNSATRVLILAPTRELARQIDKQAQALAQFTSISSGLITGGDSMQYQRALLRKNPEIIVATPGRILEHSQQQATDFSELEFLVLDEADQMLDLGFSDDVLAIAEFTHKNKQSLLFSATLKTAAIKKITEQILRNPKSINLNHIEDTPSQISQAIITADDLTHKEKLTSWLLQNDKYRKAVVFCNTKAQVDRLGGLLRYHKLKAATLHGDIGQDVRNQIMTQFRDGKFDVLVASDVAARGLDVSEVDLVINFDMPQSLEDYIHRIGRTGRAGQDGSAITLVTHKDWNFMASFERKLDIKFELRVVKALIGKYKGPQKLKASGKAASSKKKAHKKPKTAREKKRLAKKHNKKTQTQSDNTSSTTSPKPKKKFGAVLKDAGDLPMRKK